MPPPLPRSSTTSPGLQLGERRGVAAAEAGEHGLGGEVAGLVDAVEAAGELVLRLDALGRSRSRSAPAAAATGSVASFGRDGALRVVVADLPLEVLVFGLAHHGSPVVEVKSTFVGFILDRYPEDVNTKSRFLVLSS